ncbi:hypothetical protein TSAR_011169 [Trichomalopsis sarcophagae]|uniref:Uncharacterized protein n=1 Tax=Trichomalopsis sarcophagae TaxID=543379 RepID=A0A232EQQ8_9HYME|nr:hypothetical protein TSAR_011169 [Trichomalopsis sarcophagae]
MRDGKQRRDEWDLDKMAAKNKSYFFFTYIYPNFRCFIYSQTASFDLTFAQQQLNSNPTLCNQPLPPSLNNLFRDNGVNDLAWRQAIGPYGRFGLGWKMPDPWSRVPQEYPVPDPSTGMFDPSRRSSCGQSPGIQPPPPIIPPIRPPNWPYYPWNSPVCQQTPARIDQQQDLDDNDDDDDADEEDVNINSNTNTNSNVKG